MAERDAGFVRDVLEIVYHALRDRPALAAALGPDPMAPVAIAAASAGQNPAAPFSGTEIIIRVGATPAPTVVGTSSPFAFSGCPPPCPDPKGAGFAAAALCPDPTFSPYQAGSFAEPIEDLITAIAESLSVSRPEVVDEALSRLIAAEIQRFAADRGVPGPSESRQASEDEPTPGPQNE